MEWDLAETTECPKAKDFHPIGPDCGMTEESVLLGTSMTQLYDPGDHHNPCGFYPML